VRYLKSPHDVTIAQHLLYLKALSDLSFFNFKHQRADTIYVPSNSLLIGRFYISLFEQNKENQPDSFTVVFFKVCYSEAIQMWKTQMRKIVFLLLFFTRK